MSGSSLFHTTVIWASISAGVGSACAWVPGIVASMTAAMAQTSSGRSDRCTRRRPTRVRLLLPVPPTELAAGFGREASPYRAVRIHPRYIGSPVRQSTPPAVRPVPIIDHALCVKILDDGD